MCHQWEKRTNSTVISTTSSASLENLSSSTNVGTVVKSNEWNKNKKEGAITDKLDSNSRNKKTKG